MLASFRTTRARIVIGFAESIALVSFWVAFELSIAILPALMIPIWLPIFARQEEPLSPGTRRFMLASLAAGVLMFLVGVYVFYVRS